MKCVRRSNPDVLTDSSTCIPVMRKNYGQWAYHEDPRPGVLVHVANNGDKIWTVRAGTQRILDVFTLRKLCDIGDTVRRGYVRFTIRSNIEYHGGRRGQGCSR